MQKKDFRMKEEIGFPNFKQEVATYHSLLLKKAW